MSLIVVGSMAFDAIETPFGKSDKIVGGAATYIAWSASNFTRPVKQISVVGGDFPKQELKMLEARAEYLAFFKENPEAKTKNSVFGNLGKFDCYLLERKHLNHHFGQFGLL